MVYLISMLFAIFQPSIGARYFQWPALGYWKSQSRGCLQCSFQIYAELYESTPELALVSRLLLPIADIFRTEGDR